MRYLILFFLLIPSFSMGATTIQAKDIPTIQADCKQIAFDTQQLVQFAQSVQQAIASNYSFLVPGTQETVTMTAQQQTDMFTAYTQLKATLQIDVQSLP